MITALTLNNYMSHKRVHCEDIPRVNVLIGKNDSGKTGLLKSMYAPVKSIETYSKLKGQAGITFKNVLSTKLMDTFMVRSSGLGSLVTKGSNDRLSLDIKLRNESYQQDVNFSFSDSTTSKIINSTEAPAVISSDELNALFLPAKEILSILLDIKTLRDNNYGLGFDDTYLDLANALLLPTQVGRPPSNLSGVNRLLEDMFRGRIEQTKEKNKPFVFRRGNQKYDIHLTAEGIKKIGILTTLINNRQLHPGTILFIDEPETNLHPDAVRVLMKMIVQMAGAGIQTFVATHSYFAIKQVALSAAQAGQSALCWSLSSNDQHATEVEFDRMIDGILPANSILQEMTKILDEETEYALS